MSVLLLADAADLTAIKQANKFQVARRVSGLFLISLHKAARLIPSINLIILQAPSSNV